MLESSPPKFGSWVSEIKWILSLPFHLVFVFFMFSYLTALNYTNCSREKERKERKNDLKNFEKVYNHHHTLIECVRKGNWFPQGWGKSGEQNERDGEQSKETELAAVGLLFYFFFSSLNSYATNSKDSQIVYKPRHEEK